MGKSERELSGDSRAGVWAVVVAAGEGNRFGGAKQFRPLGDRRVIDWAVQGAARCCQGVVVVLAEERTVGEDAWSPSLAAGSGGEVVVTAGGVLRSDSVRCGLSRVPGDAGVVLVHDGARPLAGDGVFMRVIQAVRDGADAAVPVIDLTDTIRRRSGRIADRREFVAVQTPQAFRADVLRAAHAAGADATDDATLVEAAGGTVAMVAGDSRNLKITEPHDLAIAEALLRGPAGRRANPVHTGGAVARAARERSEQERESPRTDSTGLHLPAHVPSSGEGLDTGGVDGG